MLDPPEVRMTLTEWRALPKDQFHGLIKRWCFRHHHVQRVADRGTYIEIPARLPYRKAEQDGWVCVDGRFLEMVRRSLGAKGTRSRTGDVKKS